MKKGFYLVFATACISGLSIFMNKWAVKGFNPYLFTWSKNILVAIFLFSMLFLMKDWKDLTNLKLKQWGQLITIGLLGGSIPFLLFFKGLQLTSAANAAFIHKSMFVYIAILAGFFLKEKINKNFFIGALLLLIGNYLFLKFQWVGFDTGSLLILIATLFWAVENTLSKYVLKSLSSRIVAFGRMFFGSLFILAFLIFTGNITELVTFSLPQLGWVLFTSILLLAYVTTWYEGLRTVNVSIAACILLLGSVITTALQLAFLDKVITLSQGMGMFILVAGIITVIGFSNFKLLVKRSSI